MVNGRLLMILRVTLSLAFAFALSSCVNSNPTINQLGLKIAPLGVNTESSNGFSVYQLGSELDVSGTCSTDILTVEVRDVDGDWINIVGLQGAVTCSANGQFQFHISNLLDFVDRDEDTIAVRGRSGRYFTEDEEFTIYIKKASITNALANVNLVNQGYFPVAGTCQFLSNLVIAVGDLPEETVDCVNDQFAFNFDVSSVTESGSPTVVPVILKSSTTTDILFTTSFNKDATIPSDITAIALTTPASSPGNNKNPIFEVTGVEPLSTVKLFLTQDCSGSALQTTVAGAVANSVSFSLSNLADDEYTVANGKAYHVQTIDSFGNPGPCSAPVGEYVLDTVKPRIQLNPATLPLAETSLTSFSLNLDEVAQPGDNLTLSRYKYKVFEGNIDRNGGYAFETSFAEGGPIPPISLDVSSLADGQVFVCVKGGDSVGNWQLDSNADCFQWLKDTSGPTVVVWEEGSTPGVFDDQPWVKNPPHLDQTSFNLKFTGDNLTEFKYEKKFGLTPDCTGTWQTNNPWIPVDAIATNPDLNLNTSGDPDGWVYLCVLGKDSEGLVQSLPSYVRWIKDTQNPTMIALEDGGTIPSIPLINNGPKFSGPTDQGPLADRSQINTFHYLHIDNLADDIFYFKYYRGEAKKADGVTRATTQAEAETWAKRVCDNPSYYSSYLWYQDLIAPTSNSADLGSITDGWAFACFTGKDNVDHTMVFPADPTPGTDQNENIADTMDNTSYHAYVWFKDLTPPTLTALSKPGAATHEQSITNDGDRVKNIVLHFGSDSGDIKLSGTDPKAVETDNKHGHITHFKFKVFSTGSYNVPGSFDCTGTGLEPIHQITEEFSYSIQSFPDGVVWLCAIGIDYAGNHVPDANALKFWWLKDTTPPTPVISNSPVELLNDPTALPGDLLYNSEKRSRIVDFSVTNPIDHRIVISDSSFDVLNSSPIVDFRWKFGNGTQDCAVNSGYSAWQNISTPYITSNISGLLEGAVYLCVTARDVTGNEVVNGPMTLIPTNRTWFKDTTPPVTVIVGGPGAVAADGRLASVLTTTEVVPDTSRTDSKELLFTMGISGTLDLDGNADVVAGFKYKLITTGSRTATKEDCSTAITEPEQYISDADTSNDTISIDLTGKPDGQVTVCVFGRDYAGNWSYEALPVARPSRYNWIKDTTPPTIVFSTLPTDDDPVNPDYRSRLRNLNVDINSTATAMVIPTDGEVQYYNFKLGTGTKNCTGMSTAYPSGSNPSQIYGATNITNDIDVSPALSDGPVYLCAIGRDLAGNWQQSTNANATFFEWIKDTTTVTLLVNNSPLDNRLGTGVTNPQNRSRDVDLSQVGKNIAIAGTLDGDADTDKHLYAYNFQIVSGTTCPGSNTSCPTDGASCVARYSSGWQLKSVPVTTNFGNTGTNLPDGQVTICVQGRDFVGNLSYTQETWYKDTTPPVVAFSNGPRGPGAISYPVTRTNGTAPTLTDVESNTVNLTLAPISVSGTDVVSYKYFILDSVNISSGVPNCVGNQGMMSGELIAGVNNITDDISGLSEGQISICAYGKDIAGNWAYEADALVNNGHPSYRMHASTYSWKKDTTPPTAVVTDLGMTPPFLNGEIAASNLNAQITDPTDNLYRYIYKVASAGTPDPAVPGDDLAAIAATTNAPFYKDVIANKITHSLLGFGTSAPMYLFVWAQDKAGNWQNHEMPSTISSIGASWNNDRVPAVITLANCPDYDLMPNSSCSTAITPDSLATALNINLSHGLEEVTQFSYKFGTGTGDCSTAGYTNYAYPTKNTITDNFSASPDGQMHLCIKGADEHGNYETAKKITWIKDTTLPNVHLTGDVVLTANLSTSKRWNRFSGNATLVPDGVADMDLRRFSWSTQFGNGTYNSAFCNTASYGGFVTSPFNFAYDASPTAGHHKHYIYMCVRAADDVLNTPVNSLESYWLYDEVAPDKIYFDLASVTSGVTDVTSTGQFNNSYQNANSSITITTSDNNNDDGDGETLYGYQIKVARVAADNALALPTTICSNATGYSATRTLPANAAFTYTYNGGDTDGQYVACITGVDSAGNFDYTKAKTYSWILDRTGPVVADTNISSALSGVLNASNGTDLSAYKSNTQSPTFNMASVNPFPNEVKQYKYKFIHVGTMGSAILAPNCGTSGYSSVSNIGSALSVNLDTASGTGLPVADGQVALCVLGLDFAGNTAPTAVSYTWLKDTQPPTKAEITLASVGNVHQGVLNMTLGSQVTNSSYRIKELNLDFTVSGVDITEYRYKFIRVGNDSGAVPNCGSDSTGYSSPISYGINITGNLDSLSLSDGQIALCVVTKDNFNNWQAWTDATTYSWVRDTTAPVITIGTAYSSPNNVETLNLSVTSAATDYTHFQYEVRSGSCNAAPYGSGYLAKNTTISDSIASDGTYPEQSTIHVCAIGKDYAGNESTVADISWVKDVVAPVQSGAPDNITLTGASGLVVANATSAGDLSGIENKNTTMSVTVNGTNLTDYRFKVISVPTTAAPNCTGGGYGATVVGGVTGATPISIDVSNDTNYPQNKQVSLCVITKDNAGNWQTEANASTLSWIKDTQGPTATLTDNSGVHSGGNRTNDVTLDLTIGGSGVVSYKYKVVSGTTCSAGGFSGPIPIGTKITDDITGSPSEGNIAVCVVGIDIAGNMVAETSSTLTTWVKDVTKPTVTDLSSFTGQTGLTVTNMASPAAVSGKENKNLTQSLTLNMAGSTYIASYQFKVISVDPNAVPDCINLGSYNGSWTAIGTPISVDVTSDGSYPQNKQVSVCVIFKDQAGNEMTSADSAATLSWIKDTTAPTSIVTNLSGYPTGTSNSTVMNIDVGGTDVQNYQYKFGVGAVTCTGGGYSSSTSSSINITNTITSSPNLADGPVWLCVIGIDTAGNIQAQSDATSVSWTKDTVAPSATLSGNPTGSSNTVALNIDIAGTDVQNYYYKFGTGAVTCTGGGYTGPVTASTNITNDISSSPNLAEGTVWLCVKGVDTAGNIQAEASATQVSWTKDTVAPSATISGNPTGSSNTVALNIDIAGTDVQNYYYKFGTGAVTCTGGGYTGPVTASTNITNNISSSPNLTDGTVWLCVYGVDTAGNIQAEASATQVSWTKDTVEPIAISVSGIPTYATNGTLSIDITAPADAVKFRYKLGTSITYGTCGDGVYSSEYTVDAATGASHYEFTTDGGLGDGTIRLCIITADAAGNYQSTPFEATWTKDTVAPSATLSGNPTGSSNTVALNIDIAGTDVQNYYYKFGTGAVTCTGGGYTGPVTASTNITNDISSSPNLAEGTVWLCVKGVDTAGNIQAEASATQVSWTKDTVAPSATISGNPTGSSNTVTLNIDIAGTDVQNYYYKFGTGAVTCTGGGYTGPVTASTNITNNISSSPNLTDGTVWLCVYGVDTAGNIQAEASATQVSWTKDTVAPTVSLSGEPTGTNNFNSTLDITVSDGSSDAQSYYYKVASGATDCSSGVTSGPVAIGTHITTDISGFAQGNVYVCVKGIDAAGNVQATATQVVWTKDTLAPDATISGEPTGTTHIALLNVTVGGITASDTYLYKIYSGNGACPASGYSAANYGDPITDEIHSQPDGYVSLCVRGVDQIGNTEPETSAVQATWYKDSGSHHACAINSSNKLYCIGYNSSGQLGDGTTSSKNSLTAIDASNDYLKVAVGNAHTCAIQTDNSLWCWGSNTFGQLGDSTNTQRTSPVVVASGTSFLDVSAGAHHTCALKSDLTLWCWGLNNSGQLGDSSTTNRNSPVAVDTTSALPDTYTAVSSGSNHTCAVADSTGYIWCFGDDSFGQLGNGANGASSVPDQVNNSTAYQSISLGARHSCALTSGGALDCWGANSKGQLGIGNTTQQASPASVSGTFNMISSGYEHSCAINSAEEMKCWGANSYGQLGDNSTVQRTSPTSISDSGNTYLKVFSGSQFSCGMTTGTSTPNSNSVRCWGYQYFGITGGTLATNANDLQPVQIGTGTGYLCQ